MSTDPQGTPGADDQIHPPYSDPTAPIYDAPPPPPPAAAPPPPPAAAVPPPPQQYSPPPPASQPTPGAAYPSYGQPMPPQPGYPPPGAPVPGYAPYGGYAGVEHPKGTMVLVLGILSIAVCQILGPFAWVQGRNALREIDTSGQPYSNRGQVQAGMICGIVGSVLLLLGLLYFAFIIVMVVAAGTSGSIR